MASKALQKLFARHVQQLRMPLATRRDLLRGVVVTQWLLVARKALQRLRLSPGLAI